MEAQLETVTIPLDENLNIDALLYLEGGREGAEAKSSRITSEAPGCHIALNVLLTLRS